MKESRLEWKLKKTCIVAIILLIVAAGLASSGVCQSEGFELTEQKLEEEPDEKKLTTKDAGLLIMSAFFIKDKQQRQFVFTVIQELQKNGEIDQEAIQDIVSRHFEDGYNVFLFTDISFNNWGIVCPFPGLLSSFILKKPSISLLICENGYFTRDSTYYGLSDILIIGFYGEIINSPTERDSSVWQYHVDGTCVLALIKDD